MNLEVDVTSKNIKDGEPRSSLKGPIALAIKEVVGPDVGVVVGTGVCRLVFLSSTPDIPTRIKTYVLPDYARLFIERFDNGEPVEPFTLSAKEAPWAEF